MADRVRQAAEASSSDAVLRGYAPACLREPYLRAVGARGLPERQLGWILGFAEAVARYLVALLAPEGFSVLSQREQAASLRLDSRESFGTWVERADQLARGVLQRADAVAAPVAAALRHGRRPTEAFGALKALVQLRNQVAHDNAGIALRPVTDEDRALLQALVAGLGFLRVRPIHVLDRYDPVHPRYRLLRFVGAEPLPVPLARLPQVAEGVPLQPLEPLLIAEDGRCVRLGPFLALGLEAGGLVPRLVCTREKVPRLLDPLAGPAVDAPVEWGSRWVTAEGLQRPSEPSAADAALAEAAARAPEGLPDLGRAYRVEALLERGSSAMVWRVRDGAGRALAAKVLHPSLRRLERQRQRLAREEALLLRLAHPGVVRCHGVLWDCPAAPVLLMDCVEGGDLGRVFATERAAPAAAAALVGQVLDALSHVHAAGGVHRDVKPANVILSEDTAVLVDLGLARQVDDGRLTATAEGLGTLRYAAPEQIQRQPGLAVDRRADLYGAGRTLAWLVGGDAALEPDGLGRLPPGLAAVVRRATRPDPEERYPSAAAMAEALRRAAEGEWRAAPVEVGHRLSENLRITGVADEVAPGIWRAEGLELVLEEPRRIWLAVAETPGAARLAGAARATPAAFVHVGGGLLSVVLRPGLALSGIEGAPEPPASGPAPGAAGAAGAAGAEVSSCAAVRGLGQALARAQVGGGPFDAARAAFEVSRVAWLAARPPLEGLAGEALDRQWRLEGLLCAATVAALARPLDLEGWFALRLRLSRLEQPGDRLKTALAALESTPAAVSLATSRFLDGGAECLDRWRALQAGLLAGGARVPEALWAAEDAVLWHGRPEDGARAIVGAAIRPLPAAQVAAVAEAWIRAGVAGLGLERLVFGQDLWLGYRGLRSVVAVVTVASLPGNPREKIELARQLRLLVQLGVRLIGLSDGAAWRWLRREGQRSFFEIHGDPAAALA